MENEFLGLSKIMPLDIEKTIKNKMGFSEEWKNIILLKNKKTFHSRRYMEGKGNTHLLIKINQ